MIQMNLSINGDRLPDLENRSVKGKSRGGINQEFGMNRVTLLHIKQTSNKDLLYNTGNSIQYLIINYNEKKYV